MSNIRNYLILLTIIVIVVLITTFYKDHYGYDYINYYNEHGIADDCKIADKGEEFRGLLCKVDGHWIEVKQYGKR